MDLDTLKLGIKIVLCIYLVLWAYNVYCGYRFYTDTKTYGGSVLAPLLGREPGKFTCAFFAVVIGITLPETRTQLWMLRYRFFSPELPKFDSLKPLQ